MARYLAILLLLLPLATYAQGIGGIATRAFGAREWREAVATVGALPTCDTGSGVASENGVVRYVVAEQAIYRCSGGAWAVALAGGGGSDTTCLDAGVTCLFAGSATEGGPATSALSVAANAVALTTDTTGNYVASITSGAGITGGDGGSEGATLTIAATLGTEVEVSELADGTAGQLITWSAAGAPATVVTGGAGEVLTSNGAGSAPTFQAAAGGSSAFADLTSGTNTTAAMVVGSGSSFKVAGTGTIDASGIDADGDGTRELTCTSGTRCAVDFDEDSIRDLAVDASGLTVGGAYLRVGSVALSRFGYLGFGNITSPMVSGNHVYIQAEDSSWPIDLFGNVAVDAQSASYPGMIVQNAAGSLPALVVEDSAGTDALRVYNDRVEFPAPIVPTPSAVTCPDSGDVSLGTLFISAGTSYVEITNSDADGCTVTAGEPSVGGQHLTLALVATAGGVVTLSDTPGTINLSADWTPGAGDTLEATYSQTRSEWLETSRSDN